MTKEQIKAFDGSPEHQALLAEIAAVSKHFGAANPGYEIYVHGTVRSLDEQLASWNHNDSVRAGAEEILAAYKAAFGADGLEPAKIDVKRLGAWLRDFKPSKRASLAAPGLTLHGRARAIDFQVMKDGRIYAGANSKQLKSIWRAEGWDEKLKASMEAVGPSFSGPLADPDEPWHYDYAPPPAATIASAQGANLADILPATPGARACFARRHDAKHLMSRALPLSRGNEGWHAAISVAHPLLLSDGSFTARKTRSTPSAVSPGSSPTSSWRVVRSTPSSHSLRQDLGSPLLHPQTHRYALRSVRITYNRKPILNPVAVVWDKRRILPRYAQGFCECLLHICASGHAAFGA